MLTIITGGSGSGKSLFAENLAVKQAKELRYYIATMGPWDEECLKRIRRHQKMRQEKGFETIEHYGNLDMVELPCSGHTVLLECLSNLVTNLCFEEEKETKEQLVRRIMKGILHVSAQAENMIVVTNEVFSDGISYDAGTMRYLEVLGQLHGELAAVADAVVEVVYGIPVWHKGGEEA